MYKVFINEQLLIFADQTVEQAKEYSLLEINHPHSEDISTVVDWLMQEEGVRMQVNFISEHNSALETFFQSFPTIKAAGGVVRNGKDELLCINRLGKWDLPKGKMEAGESAEESAIREVEEECGINGLKIVAALPSTYHMYQLGTQTVLKETFWFSMLIESNQELSPQTEEGITEVKWVQKQDLGKIRANTYPSLLGLLS